MTPTDTGAFKRAVDPHDFEAAIETLAPDVVFSSPVVYKPYEGRDVVATILRAVSEVFEEFRYTSDVEQGDRRAMTFAARVGDKELEGVDLLRFNDDGSVAELTVMVRPMSGMHALGDAMRQKLEAAGAAAGDRLLAAPDMPVPEPEELKQELDALRRPARMIVLDTTVLVYAKGADHPYSRRTTGSGPSMRCSRRPPPPPKQAPSSPRTRHSPTYPAFGTSYRTPPASPGS